MTSCGQQFLACESIREAYDLEKSSQQNQQFIELDNLISELTFRSLRGEQIVKVEQNDRYEGTVQILNLTPAQKQFIEERYDLIRQRERGSWSLPEKVKIAAGWLNLTHNFAKSWHFPLGVVEKETYRIEVEGSPEAVFLWSVLGPFIEKLTYPIELRSMLTGMHDLDELKAIWEDLDEFYAALGITDLEELNVFRYRGGWSRLTKRVAHLEAKKKLLQGLSTKIDSSIGTFYRLYAQRSLFEQYYKKAKADGIVKRKQVITKAFQPLLTAYFGGDWLALVEYLGERPHPEEHIVSALPKPQIYSGGTARAKEISAQEGISADEIEKIAAALWQKSSGASPIEERTACLRKYWQEFDRLHTNQKTGMRPLWGLVEESRRIDLESFNDEIFRAGLYRELLPGDLIQDIEKLWGTTILTKYPERIVTEPFPHTMMAEVFGPALFFWQNCALTAWFLCEGPYSRTDMAGLAHHQRRYVGELEDMGTPVSPQMFSDLIQAEKHLGPEEMIETETTSEPMDFGITITTSVSHGSRRAGYESLRDIVTRYRLIWSEQYLEKYLKHRWESEITAAANAFFLKMGEKGGTPPTVKQFASTAALPTKHWFGGDISLLYIAIGEKIPFEPQAHLLMPADKTRFVKTVAERLPSRPFVYYDGKPAEENIRQDYKHELAEKALNFVQIKEATGNNPTLKEFSSKFKYRSVVLHEDEEQAWAIYERVVEEILRS